MANGKSEDFILAIVRTRGSPFQSAQWFDYIHLINVLTSIDFMVADHDRAWAEPSSGWLDLSWAGSTWHVRFGSELQNGNQIVTKCFYANVFQRFRLPRAPK